MRLLIDADGCPVVDIAVRLSQKANIPCLILCDTAHRIIREGVQTLVFDKGADSVDIALANRVEPGDLVITQDYGLASICLAKKATVLHQDGWFYTEDNIDALLLFRHESKKARNAGIHLRQTKKRSSSQNAAFEAALRNYLGL